MCYPLGGIFSTVINIEIFMALCFYEREKEDEKAYSNCSMF